MKNNLNYKNTSLSAYLTTDKPTDKQVIYALLSKDVNAQLNYKQIQSELAKDGIHMPLSTICGRCNDLFREQKIKISKVEEGLQHYSYRFPYDPPNEFKLTWKEKFEVLENNYNIQQEVLDACYYALKAKSDEADKYKTMFEEVEQMVYVARHEKKYTHILTKSMELGIKHIKEK